MPDMATNSYQYYPIIIENNYPVSRNQLYEKFKLINIFTRKYFYPACTDYECYKNDLSVKLANLPIVDEYKHKVLCLPYYGALTVEELNTICGVIKCV